MKLEMGGKLSAGIVRGGLMFAMVFSFSAAQAQTLKEVAQKTVLQNPEVLQRWHAYQAAEGERDVAFGGYLPKLDLTVSGGHNYRDDTLIANRSYNTHTTTLALTQMLWDGLGTHSQVRQSDHAKLARLNELYEASESAALAAAQAWFDVLRYRQLVTYAEDNYIRHRAVFVQVQDKVKAGVGRRVDLEQASGRLALAEANLLTETSNLHDVSARFLRIVGEQPAAVMEPMLFDEKALPADVVSALRLAEEHNPALRASIANVRAAEATVDVRKSTFQPRVDLRLRQDNSTNLSGYIGDSTTRTAEVVLNWNLFNGTSDAASVRQFSALLNEARDIRDKTCRDIRQTMTIAYNDTRKLTEQITYLEQHRLSIEKARDAYRQQFDIGQRSLLDLLDTENELFQAKRAYTNAEYDLMAANTRTLAGGGRLLAALGLSRLDSEMDHEAWSAGEDAATQCPPDGPQLYVADKNSLNAKAEELVRAEVAVAEQQQTMSTLPQGVNEALQGWAAAWRAMDIERYLEYYSPSFTPQAQINREKWVRERKRIIGSAQEITLEISDVTIKVTDADHVETSFKQKYRSPSYHDTLISKTLEWERSGDKWLILRETAVPQGVQPQ